MAGNATGTNETSFSQQFSKTSWWQDEPSTISAQHKRGRCLIIHYTLLQTKRNASCWGESGCYSPGAVQMASAESARGVQPFHRLGREPPSVLYAFFCSDQWASRLVVIVYAAPITGANIHKKLKVTHWLVYFRERNVCRFEAAAWGRGALRDSGLSGCEGDYALSCKATATRIAKM